MVNMQYSLHDRQALTYQAFPEQMEDKVVGKAADAYDFRKAKGLLCLVKLDIVKYART